MNILLADSGSTKTDWQIIINNIPTKRIFTKGINPYILHEDYIKEIIISELLPSIDNIQIEKIDFYGAGCRGNEANTLKNILISIFNCQRVSVNTDLLGAAHSLCKDKPGIACIIGTGSNSCYYDGKVIIENVSPLGFILGDEGSGAVLGRRLISDVLKHQLSKEVCSIFFDEYPLSADDILKKVYKEKAPNRFLASFTLFLNKYKYHPEIKDLIIQEFILFFKRNIAYYERKDLPIHFVGSVAWFFQEELRIVAQKLGYQVGTIKRSPLD